MGVPRYAGKPHTYRVGVAQLLQRPNVFPRLCVHIPLHVRLIGRFTRNVDVKMIERQMQFAGGLANTILVPERVEGSGVWGAVPIS
ncbi:MAG: hypothetical protein GFH27_549313n66 [Chloroflexi bacterium AL-W]|nr:hypothetical protein [Chloroflexi bacterium AL-N1]NOK69489.1 hypothetical protein [Chloroflexi bacterium AL-N10]NOK77454.1 hypothetical protein [Chloroflexi bacterium AL-N5]NOK84305.1 hypothetical protein [Chloroflexi bacterium AL-W]NOK91529.1 hypothetical protein [Chloroflexi bacterium AL-N15]